MQVTHCLVKMTLLWHKMMLQVFSALVLLSISKHTYSVETHSVESDVQLVSPRIVVGDIVEESWLTTTTAKTTAILTKTTAISTLLSNITNLSKIPKPTTTINEKYANLTVFQMQKFSNKYYAQNEMFYEPYACTYCAFKYAQKQQQKLELNRKHKHRNHNPYAQIQAQQQPQQQQQQQQKYHHKYHKKKRMFNSHRAQQQQRQAEDPQQEQAQSVDEQYFNYNNNNNNNNNNNKNNSRNKHEHMWQYLDEYVNKRRQILTANADNVGKNEKHEHEHKVRKLLQSPLTVLKRNEDIIQNDMPYLLSSSANTNQAYNRQQYTIHAVDNDNNNNNNNNHSIYHNKSENNKNTHINFNIEYCRNIMKQSLDTQKQQQQSELCAKIYAEQLALEEEEKFNHSAQINMPTAYSNKMNISKSFIPAATTIVTMNNGNKVSYLVENNNFDVDAAGTITHIMQQHNLQPQPKVQRIFTSVTGSASGSVGSALQHWHWPIKHEAVVEGELILGGLMMVHSREDTIICGPIMPQGGIQALEAMLYTIDRINESGLLPNITLGAHVLDDCDKDTYGLEMAVDFIKGMWVYFILFFIDIITVKVLPL